MNCRGVLPDFEICDLMRSGYVIGAEQKNAQSDLLDLPLAGEICRVDGAFQLHAGESIADALKKQDVFPHRFEAPLEVGVTYFAPLRVSYNLPECIYGYANPKSTTARNFVRVQFIADGVPEYNTLPRSFRGTAGVLITPGAYSILLSSCHVLVHQRFFDSDTRMDEVELTTAHGEFVLLYRDGERVCIDVDSAVLARDRFIFTVDLQTPDLAGAIGYRARSQGKVLDFAQNGQAQAKDFFEPIFPSESKELRVFKGELILLRTRERISVPPHLVTEVDMFNQRFGNFLAHGAGFINAGYGSENGGLPITLEVGGVDENLILHHGQRICGVKFECLRYPASSPYKGSYANPRLLPKQFREAV